MKISEKAYNVLEYNQSQQRLNYVDEQGYSNLIDIALYMKDYSWAEELSRKREIYRKIKRKRRSQNN